VDKSGIVTFSSGPGTRIRILRKELEKIGAGKQKPEEVKDKYLRSPLLGLDMDRVADALQEIKPESSWFQTRPESDRYKTNFSIESIATGIDVDFKDATAKKQGAFDYTMGFQTQRTHKEWEPTYTLPRPLNVFSIEDGAAITTRARAGVYADVSEDWTMGLEVDAYGLGGDAGVGDIWGVTPPYFSNPFVGHSNDVSLNTLWARYQPLDTTMSVGAFTPLHVGDYVLKGEPNPTFYGPDYLPFYGVNVVRRFYNPFFIPSTLYEVYFAELPEDSDSTSWLGGFYLGREYEDMKYGFNFMSPFNRGASTSEIDSPLQGTVDGSPVRWESPYNKVGKQDEFVLGADYSYNFLPTYKAWAACAHSIYRPTGSEGVDVHGNLLNTGISGTVGRISFNLEGIWVEPKYDPFVIKMERPSDVQSPGLFYELPYFTTYADSWQLHDAKKYPQNREGVRLHLDYPFPGILSFTRLFADMDYLRQIESSRADNVQEPGFIEPFFGIRTEEGTGKKGSISHGGIGVSSDLPYNHKVSLGYSLYQYSRKTDNANNMDFDVNAVSLTYGYPILYRLRSKMYFNVGNTFLAVDGEFFSESRNADFIQSAPFMGIDYKYLRSPDTVLSFFVNSRYLLQNDEAESLLLGDFDAFLTSFGLKVEF